MGNNIMVGVNTMDNTITKKSDNTMMNTSTEINDYTMKNNTIFENNILKIPIKSFSSDDIYSVTIYVNNKNEFCGECNCGLKYNVGIRKKCKHIAYCINTLVNPIIENSISLQFEFDLMKIS